MSAPETTLVDHRWRTTLSLTARLAPTDPTAGRLASTFQAEVAALERAASRFRPDSQLSAVNRGAGTWVDISAYLAEVLQAALSAAESSDGLTDPCLGAQVDAAGYRAWAAGWATTDTADSAAAAGRGWLPVDPRPPTPRFRPGLWREVQLRQRLGWQVRIHPDSQLDLGATAKAWLADRLAERVAGELRCDVVANMGGDVRAISRAEPWTVAADPQVPGVRPRTFDILDAGLTTSGRGQRRWVTPTGAAHHIIDPRTGRPATTQWWAVSVLAATATGANTASTAAMVRDGSAPRWLASLGLDAWLVRNEPAGHPSAVRVGRWPAEPGGAGPGRPEQEGARRSSPIVGVVQDAGMEVA